MTRDSLPLGAGVIINLLLVVIGLAAIALLLAGRIIGSDPDDAAAMIPDLHLMTVAGGLESPVLLVGAADGSGDRLVVEQRGTVRRLRADGTLDEALVIDLRDRVLHHGERGLLGLALHPGYAQNGLLFVLYIRAADGATVISEFDRGQGGLALEQTERVLLTIPATSTLHKGGMLAFDREGMLLAGIGDGSTGNDPAGVAQNPASLLGKVLRLDVDAGVPYGLPADNGFAGVSGARPEVHALGLRNPWRFSLDPLTGDAYIGDVGQGAWEEIDVLAAGARLTSFGWPVLEGPDCFARDPCDVGAHTAPAVVYAHDAEAGHCGVIGGYAYRGQQGSLPAGTYLYGDYCSGALWAVPVERLRAGDAAPVLAAVVPPEVGRIRSFGQDDAGELYLLTSEGLVLGLREEAGTDG